MKNLFVTSALCAVLFVALIVLVTCVDVAAIGPAGTSVGLSHINQQVRDSIGTGETWYKISKYLGYLALATAAAVAVFGLWQLIREKSLQKVDREILVLCGLYAAVAFFYVLFDKVAVNYRPVLEAGQTVPEPSFPSTHTLLACTIFGSAVMVLPKYVKNAGAARILQGCLIAAMVLTVVARLLSGVHWVTDIIGGLLLSTALLALTGALLSRKSAEA